MMNRFPKVLLTLLLTLLLALSLSGCDLMVGTGPEAPIPPRGRPAIRIPPIRRRNPGYEYAGDARRPQGARDGRLLHRQQGPLPDGPGAGRQAQARGAGNVQPDTSHQDTCTISISRATILNNMDKCDESKRGLVPADGVILPAVTVTFSQGESVFDVLQRVCKERKIPMEFSWTPMYNSAYIEGIYNLYEFDVGDGSGWMYKVNDWLPNYGCSRYQVQPGDVICWVYTRDLGYDVGGGFMLGGWFVPKTIL